MLALRVAKHARHARAFATSAIGDDPLLGVLQEPADKNSDDFKTNRAQMLDLVADLRSTVSAARAGGGQKARMKHEERGKLLPRARIDALLDKESPFLEVCSRSAADLRDSARSRLPALTCFCEHTLVCPVHMATHSSVTHIP